MVVLPSPHVISAPSFPVFFFFFFLFLDSHSPSLPLPLPHTQKPYIAVFERTKVPLSLIVYFPLWSLLSPSFSTYIHHINTIARISSLFPHFCRPSLKGKEWDGEGDSGIHVPQQTYLLSLYYIFRVHVAAPYPWRRRRWMTWWWQRMRYLTSVIFTTEQEWVWNCITMSNGVEQ